MTSIEQLLSEQRLSILFQPIVGAGHHDILGYEALARGPQYTPYHSAGALFNLARATGKQLLLERHCLELALMTFQQFQPGNDILLFINLSPQALYDIGVNHIHELAKKYLHSPEQLIIELTEQPHQEAILLSELIRELQHCGIGIAIDDLGSAYSGLRRWLELKPDYVKLDRAFIQNIEQDTNQQKFVSQLLKLAAETGSLFIVEGVETRGQWQSLLSLGVIYFQGFAIAYPAPGLNDNLPLPPAAHNSDGWSQLRKKMRQFVHPVATLLPDALCDTALALFNADESLQCLPVVDAHGMARGVLRRQVLLSHFAERFGHSLYSRQPISKFMDQQPVMVEGDMDLLQVSQAILAQNSQEMDSRFLICEQGKFLGLGYLNELVHQLTEYQIQMARHANPLTQLPGNVPIHQTIDQAISQRRRFHLAYCDLNHFKPYNDICGYDRGDLVIRMLADLLRQHLGHPDNFIGHLGGDDYILLLRAPEWSSALQQLQQSFARVRRQFYRDVDWNRGGIEGQDRDGQTRLFPLLSLAIGVVPWHPESHTNRSQLIEALTQAKKMAKQGHGQDYWLAAEAGAEVALLAG